MNGVTAQNLVFAHKDMTLIFDLGGLKFQGYYILLKQIYLIAKDSCYVYTCELTGSKVYFANIWSCRSQDL